MKAPAESALVPMRRLANELAAARGALDVGLVVTVTPYSSLDLRVRKDRSKMEAIQAEKPLKIEAKTEIEVSIAEDGTVRVRAGRREAQENAESLEDRWSLEVEPFLTAAGVLDIEGLEREGDAEPRTGNRDESGGCRIGCAASPIGALSGAPRSCAKRPAVRKRLGRHWAASLSKHWRRSSRSLARTRSRDCESGVSN